MKKLAGLESLAVLLAACACVSCSGRGNPIDAPAASKDIMPLEIGRSWTRFHHYFSIGVGLVRIDEYWKAAGSPMNLRYSLELMAYTSR
jgi:hypothetical protein